MSRERGVRRERVFFDENDDALYRNLLASQCRKDGVAVCPLAQCPTTFVAFSSPIRKEPLERPRASRSGKAALWPLRPYRD